jgi:putative ubiquitin-RnfH superfamily antitoxin RatB of RatAB toxin-antitoxin module
VEFNLHYEFSSRLIEKAVGPVFSHIANTFVDSFVKRAARSIPRAEMSDSINVDVCYALPGRPGDRIFAARRQHRNVPSRHRPLQKHPEIDLLPGNKLGIFAKLVKADTVLRDRDRVEIYRPLIADPGMRASGPKRAR